MSAIDCIEDENGRILLSDGFSTAREYYTAVYGHVAERVPEAARGRIYTAKTLSGDDFWSLLSPGERRLAGRCIAHMVVRGLLPLVFVKAKHEYPLRYRIST